MPEGIDDTMEQIAVHRALSPEQPLAPSLVTSELPTRQPTPTPEAAAAALPSPFAASPPHVSPPPELGSMAGFDDILPLPSSYNPDVPALPVPVADVDQELMLQPIEQPAEEPALESVAERIQVDTDVGDEEGERDPKWSDDPALAAMLESLRGTEDLEGLPSYQADSAPSQEQQAAHGAIEHGHLTDEYSTWGLGDKDGNGRQASSPPSSIEMSPIPDLPTELPDDVEIAPIASLPEDLDESDNPLMSLGAISHAESSTAAATRAREEQSQTLGEVGCASPAASPVVVEEARTRKRAKSPVDDTPTEQESESERDQTNAVDAGKPKRKYRKLKDIDGKPLRVSNKPRKRLDASLGIYRDGDKPLEKVAPRAPTVSDKKLEAMCIGKTQELQIAPCIRHRYDGLGKCTQCVSKIGGDSCRFRNYRSFPLDPKTGKVNGPGWFESTELEKPMTELPQQFNTDLLESHIKRAERAVAPLLLRLVTRELRHVVNNNAIHRPIDAAQHRSVCDFCASTIFAGFWFCTKCGRDYCLQCERYFGDSNETMNISPWPLPDAARPRVHRCSGGRKGSQISHFRPDLKPTSRFSADELRTNWLALIDFVLDPSDKVNIDEQLRIMGIDSTKEPALASVVREWYQSRESQQHPPPSSLAMAPELVDALYEASKDLPTVPDPAGLSSHPFIYIDADQLTDELFDQLWSRGEPMVAHNILPRFKMDWGPDEFIRRFGTEPCYVMDCQTEISKKMSIGRFFALFKDRQGEYIRPSKTSTAQGSMRSTQPNDGAHASRTLASATSTPGPDTVASASFVETQTNGDKPGNVSDRPVDLASPATSAMLPVPASPAALAADSSSATPTAGVAANGDGDVNGTSEPNDFEPLLPKPKAVVTQVLKLKDWPSTDDFSTAYPDLYNDFCDALPVPDYTRRNGVLNLYSHFPPGATRPDIGPKMYNAFAAQEGPDGQGSTRLHMDVADAINIMLYASDRPDGSPGCAVWDLFRAEDADAIRTFLKDKYSTSHKFTDPIHAQMFYLNSDLRRELFEKHGIASFRVYQYPGQAVFIPAGCAHQVCNLADCIKIALDFVSPHNVRRCQRLTQDFREENFKQAWKDDVLQLYNVMWYAWTNVRETRERNALEAAAYEAERVKRAAHLKALTNDPYERMRNFRSPLTSSVRDDPTPTSPLGSDERGTAQERASPAKTPEGADKDASDVASDSPAHALALRLLDAVLTRDPPPPPPPPVPSTGVPIKPVAPVRQPTREMPRRETPESLRLSDQIRAGHVPSALALSVISADLRAGSMDLDDLNL